MLENHPCHAYRRKMFVNNSEMKLDFQWNHQQVLLQ